MLCGCYFCIRHISSVDVDEYTDDGATALCPNCGVDALIIDVSTEELEEAHERWFCGKAKEQER